MSKKPKKCKRLRNKRQSRYKVKEKGSASSEENLDKSAVDTDSDSEDNKTYTEQDSSVEEGSVKGNTSADISTDTENNNQQRTEHRDGISNTEYNTIVTRICSDNAAHTNDIKDGDDTVDLEKFQLLWKDFVADLRNTLR